MKRCMSVAFIILVLFIPLPMLCQDEIPAVPFAVFRLDLQTYEVKGYCELEQSYRKILPGEGYDVIGESHILDVPAGDFGFTRIVSALTGLVMYEAETVWNGRGRQIFPPDHFFLSDYQSGYENGEPDSIYYHLRFATPEEADSAWIAVRDSDVINRLSTGDTYSILIHEHFFSVGAADPATAEWVVIAYTVPQAPPDMAVLSLDWPRTLLTKDMPVIFETTIHNFGSRSECGLLEAVVTLPSAIVYANRVEFDDVAPDVSQHLLFDEWTPDLPGTLTFYLQLLDNLGGAWSDPYPENDTVVVEIEITPFPIFKVISSLRYPGHFPVNGTPGDIDDDGDIDVFQHGFSPRLLQNRGDGRFDDITETAGVLFDHHPRMALIEDLTGDGLTDILIVYYDKPVQLIAGVGDGTFREISEPSGVAGVIGTWWATSFDMEGDGDTDLLFPQYENVVVLRNEGGQHFEDVTIASGIYKPGQTISSTAGDIDGDGDIDLFLVNWDSYGTGTHHMLYINNGRGVFYPQPGPWEDGGFGRSAIIFDFNNDNMSDIYLASVAFGEAGSDRLYQNLGQLEYSDATAAAGICVSSFNVDCGDFDMDGDLDILTDEILYVNTGEGTFSDKTCLLIHDDGRLSDQQFLDVDGDEDLDIYSAGAVFENMGVPGHIPGEPRKGDINQDGGLDITDVVFVVHIILDIKEPTPLQFWAADYNGDDVVNVLDVVLLVNAILS